MPYVLLSPNAAQADLDARPTKFDVFGTVNVVGRASKRDRRMSIWALCWRALAADVFLNHPFTMLV